MRPLSVLALALLIATTAAAQTKPRRPPPAYPVSPAPAAAPLAPELSSRLYFLQGHLERLAQRNKMRFWQGSLQLALGAGLGVGAVFIEDPGGRALFALGGAAALGRGSARLAVDSGALRLAGEFASMLERDAELARRKIAFGAAALAQIARKERRLRLIDGALGMLSSASFVPLYWGLRKHEDPDYRFGDYGFDYANLSLSVIGFAAGLVQVLVAGDAEQRYEEYRRLP
jgi:hypothetical protein